MPWGLDGGREATGNEVALRLSGAWKEDFPNAKVLVSQLKSGDAFRMRSGGGGGYGDPLARSAKDVAHDAKQEYISLRSAREYYGVVLDPTTFAVDQDATAKRRAAMRAAPAVLKTA